MQPEIADLRISVKVKHVYFILFTVVIITTTAVIGWHDLKAEATSGNITASALERRVSRIECLVEQNNNFQIWQIKPTRACE